MSTRTAESKKLTYENTITVRGTLHTTVLLFTVVLGNRTSKSLFSGFVDDKDV